MEPRRGFKVIGSNVGVDCAILLRRCRPHISRTLLCVEAVHARLSALGSPDWRSVAVVHLTHLSQTTCSEGGLVWVRVHVAVTALAVRRRGHVGGGRPSNTAHVRTAGGASGGRLVRLNTGLQSGRRRSERCWVGSRPHVCTVRRSRRGNLAVHTSTKVAWKGASVIAHV